MDNNKTTTKKETKFNDYEGFVEKFKPKKTTDDCYTPSYIYDAVLEWLKDHADLEGREIVRPFWPGGDYKTVDYPEGCVVVDNPPFSILAEIKGWYAERRIPFFLFAPHLTLFSSYREDQTFIITDASIRYENGVIVNTDFVTNLPEFSAYGIIGEPSLKEAIENAQREALKLERAKAELPKYSYPPHLVTTSSIAYIIGGGVSVRIPRKEMVFVRRMDAQIPIKKAIFGGGFLCSDRIAEKLKAEKLKAAYIFKLSEREKELIESLNDENN